MSSGGAAGEQRQEAVCQTPCAKRRPLRYPSMPPTYRYPRSAGASSGSNSGPQGAHTSLPPAHSTLSHTSTARIPHSPTPVPADLRVQARLVQARPPGRALDLGPPHVQLYDHAPGPARQRLWERRGRHPGGCFTVLQLRLRGVR
jgi:hypothetical protein